MRFFYPNAITFDIVTKCEKERENCPRCWIKWSQMKSITIRWNIFFSPLSYHVMANHLLNPMRMAHHIAFGSMYFSKHSPWFINQFSYAACLRIIPTIHYKELWISRSAVDWQLHAVDLNWITIKIMDFCCVLLSFSRSRFNAESIAFIAFQGRSRNEAHTTKKLVSVSKLIVS